MKKVFAFTVVVIILLSLCACSDNSEKFTNNDNTITTNAPTLPNETNETAKDTPIEKDGFDSATNEIYKFAGYSVEIPNYWKSENKISDGILRYAETNGKVAMLQISVQKESDDSYPVSFDGLMSDNDNMIAMIESTMFKKVTNYEIIDTGVVKGILYKGTIKDKDSGLSGYGEWFVFASEKDRTWCTLIMCQTENTDYLYTGDFNKIIQSIKLSKAQAEDGIRPNFKEAMDSYEAFMDEYVAFMKKYSKNPTDLSLLENYTTIMTKYTEFAEDFEKWENEDLNNAELSYYLEVANRVNRKLLSVAE